MSPSYRSNLEVDGEKHQRRRCGGPVTCKCCYHKAAAPPRILLWPLESPPLAYPFGLSDQASPVSGQGGVPLPQLGAACFFCSQHRRNLLFQTLLLCRRLGWTPRSSVSPAPFFPVCPSVCTAVSTPLFCPSSSAPWSFPVYPPALVLFLSRYSFYLIQTQPDYSS